MSMSCKRFCRLLAWPAAALLWGGVAGAQDPAIAPVPPPPPAQVPPPSAGSPAAPESPPARAAKPALKSTAQSEAGEPRATSALPSPATPGRAPAATPKAPGAADRLNLNTATVTGDREQPKVMYIVPWKRADIGDLSGKPMNSLLDEALAPVDRDEFKREITYYDAMNKDAPHNGASKAGEPGEK